MKILRKMILIFSLLVMICLTKNVSAAVYYDGITSHLNVGGCNLAYKYCWANIDTSFELQGIRVTAYNQEGQRVSKSVDFTNDQSIISTINASTYYMAADRENNSRVDYMGSPSVSRATGSPDIQYVNFASFIQTQMSGSINLENIISNVKSDIEYKLEICTGKYKNMCTRGRYYLVVEPLTIIWSRAESYDYYGTYYELTYMIENSQVLGSYPFKKGNGVSPFLPGNIALSLYISTDTAREEFNSFYNKIELERVGTEELKDVKYYINNYFHSDLKNKTVGSNNVKKGYGIGVALATYGNSNENEEPADEEAIHINLCNDHEDLGKSGVIWVQYKDRTFTDEDGREYSVKSSLDYSKPSEIVNVCRAVCSEKYYIEAWGLNNSLNPINGEGLLAGTYVTINSPTVYHKKTCEFKWDISMDSLRTAIYMRYLPPNLTITNEAEFERRLKLAEAEYISIINQCNGLETEFKEKIDNVEKDAANDTVGDLELTLFSTYKLTAKKTATQISKNNKGTINGESYQYGYHNTFVYSIDGNVNKYIGMDSVVNDKNNNPSTTNIGNGIAKATTSITIKQGYYNYKIDYLDIFKNNNNFSKMVNNNSLEEKLDATCPYVIVERNISNTCVPTETNGYCGGDPNNNFELPKIRVQYRAIDLSHPFPGKLGTIRTPGANWQSVKDLEDGNEVTIIDYVDTYITHNRNLEKDQFPEAIYTEKDPIYTITLDANSIKKIREYNKNNSYDDFQLNCTEGKGTECISSFLRNKDYVNLSGECSSVTTTDRSKFYTCADK